MKTKESLSTSGITHRGTRKTESGISLTITHNDQDTAIKADQALVATGRAPNVEGLNLAEYGVAVSPKGGIVVDDRMRTSKIGIYAAGDVIGRDQFSTWPPTARSSPQRMR